MKITIQTLDFKGTEKLNDYVTRTVMKLSNFSDRIVEAQVVLRVDKSDTKRSRVCELKLVIPGNDLFARRESRNFENAVLQSVKAVKHQVIHWKDAQEERVH